MYENGHDLSKAICVGAQQSSTARLLRGTAPSGAGCLGE